MHLESRQALVFVPGLPHVAARLQLLDGTENSSMLLDKMMPSAPGRGLRANACRIVF